MSHKAQIAVVAIGWYSREDYPDILAIMEDAEKFPKTYDRWLQTAETGERRLQESGNRVVRATIDPKMFVAWCNAQGLRRDANSRISFSNETAFTYLKSAT
jgi:hypothetical protein